MQMNSAKTAHGKLSAKTYNMETLLCSEIEGFKELISREKKQFHSVHLINLWLSNLRVSVEMKIKLKWHFATSFSSQCRCFVTNTLVL
jgi:hypothetical protein